MLFQTFDEKRMLAIHAPNNIPNGATNIFEVDENNGKLKIQHVQNINNACYKGK
ncbi:hypothetical protein [Evansella vedderi]|uniref:hypothetical protein n=1 Tax=Evansella vedderi TaxID=38282 RepID=UPI0027D92F03|nr:hypothetical protein [Evansella vedderi]